MKILVLGGTGFIGSAVVRLLRDDHNEVTVGTRADRVSVSPLHADIVRLKYDLPTFKDLLQNNYYDQVHFLGGNPTPLLSQDDPLLDLSATNMPFLALLEAARQIAFSGSLWFASSVAVYGKPATSHLREDAVCQPLSLYGLGKQFSESHCQYYSSAFGIHTGAYRLFSTFGPGLKRQLVFDILQRLTKDTAVLEMLGTGEEARDLSYVWDQANAIRVLSRDIVPNGDIFNIGRGEAHTVREVVECICSILGMKPAVIFNGTRRNFEADCWCADVEKLRALGITPKYTLENGLKETVAAFVSGRD